MGGRTQTNSQMAVPAPKFLLTLPQVGREGMSWQTRAEHYLYDHIYIYICMFLCCVFYTFVCVALQPKTVVSSPLAHWHI